MFEMCEGREPMKRTKLLTVGTLAVSLGWVGCDETTPVGVPDEVETEETLEGWSEEMVEEARTETTPPQNVDEEYRSEQREEELSGQAKEFAKKATAETPPSEE